MCEVDSVRENLERSGVEPRKKCMGIWQGPGVSQCLSDLSLWNQLSITLKKNTDKGERRSRRIRLHFSTLPKLNRNVRMSKKGIVFLRMYSKGLHSLD